MNEVYPVVLVNREFGKLLDDILIDYPALTGYMRMSGFNDDEIAATQIKISNETVSKEYKNEPGKVYTTYGSYQHIDGAATISLYPLETLEEARRRKAEGDYFLNKPPEQGVSEYFSETLVHELEHHAIRTIEGGMTREFYSYAIGRFGLRAAAVSMNALAPTGVVYRTIEQLLPSVPFDNLSVQVGAVAAALAIGLKKADQTITGYDFYYSSPEEMRCRYAERYAPDNLIRFRLRDL